MERKPKTTMIEMYICYDRLQKIFLPVMIGGAKARTAYANDQH
jgi:hypothetical protein